MPQRLPKVSIIGGGVVGSILGSALFDKGYRFASIIDSNGSKALSLARSLKCDKAGIVIDDVALSSEIILITVNDSAISTIAGELAKYKKLYHKKLLIVQCSGAYSADILDPLRKKGSITASMHPLQTFPSYQSYSRMKSKLKGMYYGIDGSPEAIKKVEQIVQTLEGKSIVIPAGLKPLYHVACVFASNYMTAFLNTISELTVQLKLKGSWMEIFGPLMTTTMENVIKTSAPKALTGPIVRSDLPTLDLHLKTLLEHAPQFLPLYTVGGIEVARIAKENGRITQEDFNKIILKFRKFIQSSSLKKISKVKH